MSNSEQPPRARLLEALMRIAATRGLDQVSVREVAAAARVSIGAVQHHFSTKDEMLAFAFRHIVEHTQQRISVLPLGPSVKRNLSRILRELLPLDETRRREARVYVAFAARAALVASLAEIQRDTQARLHAALTEALKRAESQGLARGLTPALAPAADAALLLAVADGLTFDAVSEPERLPPRELEHLLDLYLERLLGKKEKAT